MNQSVIAFLYNHATPIALGTLWMAGAFVSSLPAPTATSGLFYQWFYKFVNLLVANLDKLSPVK